MDAVREAGVSVRQCPCDVRGPGVDLHFDSPEAALKWKRDNLGVLGAVYRSADGARLTKFSNERGDA